MSTFVKDILGGYKNIKMLSVERKNERNIWKIRKMFISCTAIKEKHIPDDSCPDGGIGRRAGLKHQWSNIHPGSTPGLGTRKKAKYLIIQYLAFSFA